jgi:hypothetical protein
VRVALWVPPVLLAALLIAGPVSASGGTPAAAPHHAVAARADAAARRLRPVDQDPSSCAVVIAALSGAGKPVGPGTCLAPAVPSAVPGAGVDSTAATNTQVVTQSIGLEVRPG